MPGSSAKCWTSSFCCCVSSAWLAESKHQVVMKHYGQSPLPVSGKMTMPFDKTSGTGLLRSVTLNCLCKNSVEMLAVFCYGQNTLISWEVPKYPKWRHYILVWSWTVSGLYKLWCGGRVGQRWWPMSYEEWTLTFLRMTSEDTFTDYCKAHKSWSGPWRTLPQVWDYLPEKNQTHSIR